MTSEGIQIAGTAITAFVCGLGTMYVMLGHARRVQNQATANVLDLLDWRANRGLRIDTQQYYAHQPEQKPFQPDYIQEEMSDEERQLRMLDAQQPHRMTDEREAAIADRIH